MNGTRNNQTSAVNTHDHLCSKVTESDITYYANIGISELYGTSERLERAGLTIKQASRFFPKIQVQSGCWLWTSNLVGKGYGQFGVATVNGKQIKAYAHRLMWLLAHSEIPDGMEVCHHCDTPACCNPAHLFLGTHTDNMRDSARKGRKGTPWKHRAYPDHVLEEAMNAKRGGIIALARQHGVSFKALYMQVRRERIRRQQRLPGKAA